MTPTSMTPLRRQCNPFSSSAALLLCALWPIGSIAGKANGNSNSGGDGYRFGERIPVSCLNRTLDSGEHITDDLGKLQYIPFATCNETSLPLSLHYGVSETITCTVPVLSDNLYHLLEYYVHSDAPMTCRVPTAPLRSSSRSIAADEKAGSSEGKDSLAALNENGLPFTPLTIALQGTLQLSHLHIWTDMNVLMHSIASDAAVAQQQLSSTRKHKKRTGETREDGYVVAGAAYSVPEFDAAAQKQLLNGDEDDAAVALVQAARDPWTAGHGTKVVRGEPLTFSFRVAWIEGGAGIGWPARPESASFLDISGTASSCSGCSGSFARLLLFLLAASCGAFGALYWERNGRRWRSGGSSWHGDGILGVPPIGGKGTGVAFGNAGRINGYGGYTTAGNGAAAGTAGAGSGYSGYGGLSTGKKD